MMYLSAILAIGSAGYIALNSITILSLAGIFAGFISLYYFTEV